MLIVGSLFALSIIKPLFDLLTSRKKSFIKEDMPMVINVIKPVVTEFFGNLKAFYISVMAGQVPLT